jgi:lysozyme
MKVSKRGLVEIASHEGIVPMPYLDSVGVWTVGIGHAEVSGRPPNPRHMARGFAIPMTEVFELFEDDIAAFARDVDRAVKVPVEQHEFDALVSFHYNTGGIFRASITKFLNRGDRKRAADAFMMWRRPPDIIGRRKKEQTLFRTGSYSSGGWASVYKANRQGRILWHTHRRMNVMEMLGEEESEKITAILRAGSVGEDVKRMQGALQILTDGVFGPQTLAALKDYQEQHGLTVDGIAGPQTLGHMGLA